jgi:hypothetical protein
VAEWSIAPDSKSGVPQGTGGSNPSLSAISPPMKGEAQRPICPLTWQIGSLRTVFGYANWWKLHALVPSGKTRGKDELDLQYLGEYE